MLLKPTTCSLYINTREQLYDGGSMQLTDLWFRARPSSCHAAGQLECMCSGVLASHIAVYWVNLQGT
jgi:hypothetical protein